MNPTAPHTKDTQYHRAQSANAPVICQAARFRGTGGTEEIHLIAEPTDSGDLARQLDWLHRATNEFLDKHNLPPESVVFRRFFCSDYANQITLLREHAFSNPRPADLPCAVSYVAQPPSPPARVALWAYHVSDPAGPLRKRREGNTLILERPDLTHFWTCGLLNTSDANVANQTTAIFAAYNNQLRDRDLNLADHVQRTWLFLRDIDADYTAMTAARREFFKQHGLTPETHYIASTGIEAAGLPPETRLTLDAYAIAGLQPAQIRHLRAPEQLSTTDTYGVTFERGTTVAYRDRQHVIISGTASIDQRGQVLHVGDIDRQLDRTLENIETLLRQAGAAPTDLGHLITYLRDPADAPHVRATLRQRYPDVPLLTTQAAVCRPTWLIEIEVIAITPANATGHPRL